ncbi:MAG: hypothetical protein AB1489_42140 [Acidobacteriota bacterium]
MSLFKNTKLLWRLLLASTVLVLALSAIIFFIRFQFILHDPGLYPTTGTEAISIYNIWKVQNGHILYEWPNRDNYAFTVYNYLFYYTYAHVLAVLGIGGKDLVFYGRLLTLAFALIGATAQWQLTRSLNKDYYTTSTDIFLALLALMVWFGTAFVGWWSLTVRPDVPAVALVTLALLAYLRGITKGSHFAILIASILFFSAWSFKQPVVWALSGVSLYALIYRRDWKEALVLILPCALLMAVCLILGGPAYRYNILAAHINTISLQQSVREFVKLAVSGLFIWGSAGIGLWLLLVSKSSPSVNAWREGESAKYMLFVFVFIATVLLGTIALGKAGAVKNHLFEAFVGAGVFSATSFIKLFNTDHASIRTRTIVLALALMLSMMAFPIAQLGIFNRLPTYGVLTPASPAEQAKKKVFADFLATLPKPLYLPDEMLALPWYATDNKYPAINLDEYFYFPAKQLGLLQGRGVSELVYNKHFRTLIIPKENETYQPALAAGYQLLPLREDLRTLRSNSFYTLQDLNLFVLTNQATEQTEK